MQAKEAYKQFLEYWDPYNTDDIPETPEGMLYNLKEIKKDLEQWTQPENDWTRSIMRINDTIKQIEGYLKELEA